jgi:hypothetical protein
MDEQAFFIGGDKMSNNAQMADMLFPFVKMHAEEVIALYPPRKLPAGAMVTRLAPSQGCGAGSLEEAVGKAVAAGVPSTIGALVAVAWIASPGILATSNAKKKSYDLEYATVAAVTATIINRTNRPTLSRVAAFSLIN